MSDEKPVEDGTHHPEENLKSPAGLPKPPIPPPPVAPPPPAHAAPPLENKESPPPSPPPDGPSADSAAPDVPPASNEKMLAMLCHLLALLGVVPPLNIVAPFILWLVKKDEVPAVDVEGKKSVNFQATVSVAAVVLYIVAKVGSEIPLIGGLAGFLGLAMLYLLAIGNLALVVVAAIRINNGQAASYPFAYDFIALFAPKGDDDEEA